MEYGLILYNESYNLGDDIQSYATMKFLPHIDYIIDREHMNEFRTDDGKQAAVIMSGWFLYDHYSWPPSPYIKPLLTSMHFDTYFSLLNNRRLTENEVLSGYGAEWLNKYGPVGARDESTLNLLESRSIPSYLSGCITLTIKPLLNVQRHGKIVTVDVSEEIINKIKSNTKREIEQVSHSLLLSGLDYKTRFGIVEEYLRSYQGAFLVVTGRLHAALPAMALGTPVLFIDENWAKNRTSTYTKMLNSYTEEQILGEGFLYDFNDPLPNPDLYKRTSNDIENKCKDFISQLEKNKGDVVREKDVFYDLIKRTSKLKTLLPSYNPKISIIVPVFNTELYLGQCIESLLNQDLDTYEIIMVNDGSTDKSQKIIDGYCSRYPDKCISITQSNQGLGPARNAGIRAAKGKYIMFVDSDDWIEENVLGSLYRFMEKYGFSLALFDTYLIEENQPEKIIASGYPKPGPVIDKKEAVKNSTNSAQVCKRIFRHELVERREFLPIWFEDVAFTPVVTSYAETIGYFKVPVYNYRQRPGSITSQNENKRNLEIIKAWEYALENAQKNYEGEVIQAVLTSVDVFLEYRSVFYNEYNKFKSLLLECKSYKENKKQIENNIAIDNLAGNSIPKVIHYSWFGGRDESKQLKERIKKWCNDMPGYRMSGWNENTINVFEIPFSQQAYAKKRWRELSEYMRVKILYENGGIFLDNCVSSVPVSDELLENDLLIGVDPNGSYSTSVMGSVKGNPLLKIILDYYEKLNLISLKGYIKDINLLTVLQDLISGKEGSIAKVNFVSDKDV